MNVSETITTQVASIIIFSFGFVACVVESIISRILEQKHDRELPERLERFKLAQFKDGVESVKTLRANVTKD